MKSIHIKILLAIVVFILSALVTSCDKKSSSPTENTITPPSSPPSYTGEWKGTTGQGYTVYFHVNDQEKIDSLTARIKIYVGNYTATITYPAIPPITVRADTFKALLSVSFTNVSTYIHGKFTSDSTASGTYDKFAAGYYFTDGSILIIGTGGTQMSAGTWSAKRVR